MPLSITKAHLLRLMPTAGSPLLTLMVLAGVVFSCLLLSGREGRAVQAPRISLDMIIDGNAYDENTNTMVAGPIDNCLSSPPPGDNAAHNHIVHLVIQEVEDLVAWQVRFNFIGDRMRINAINFVPFTDNNAGQNVAFTNLPIDPTSTLHRTLTSAGGIGPAAPAGGSNTPQTHLAGATYDGPQTFPISPDTPAKAPPDDTSYSAPTGGVLASINLQVLPGQANQPLMTVDLDDHNPNPPGTRAVIFNGTGLNTDVNLAETSLFDGFHSEGSACVPPPGIVTPPPTTAPGGPGGPGGGGDGAGGSPGATNGAPAGGSPGTGTPGPGTTGSPDGSSTPTPTPDGDSSDEDEDKDGDGNADEDGGTPVWPFILLAVVAVAAGGGAFAAWRYRSRIPWLRDRFPG